MSQQALRASEDTVRATPHAKSPNGLHLAVLASSSQLQPQLARRWTALGFSLAAVGCLLWAYSQTWWSFILYAPQYPAGLRLQVTLTGVTGDVREIDTLNHYIGMAPLASAAPIERALAGYGITVICMLLVAALLFAGRRFGRSILIPAVILPFAFVADTFYWLYRFGHNLDPRAPLELPAFTPSMFGNGVIGQFMTFARPELGFWLAALAFLLSVVALLLRERVCDHCVRRFTCGAVCKKAFIAPDRLGRR